MMKTKLKKIFLTTFLLIATLGVAWWQIFKLEPYTIDQESLVKLYGTAMDYTPDVEVQKIAEQQYRLSFTSYDGESIEGRIELPKGMSLKALKDEQANLLLGVSAMGRNYQRWWVDEFNGNATVTQVNHLGEMALAKGYALVAIDTRYHGSRKSRDRSLSKIMRDLRLWGDRTLYEEMIYKSVLDYRHLLNWLEKDYPNIKPNVAGYSMGAQISLLLASVDQRIHKLLAMVPPYLEDTVAQVAPKNLLHNIKSKKVWLVTAKDDYAADHEDNIRFFTQLPVEDINHLVYESGHILPANYIKDIGGWF